MKKAARAGARTAGIGYGFVEDYSSSQVFQKRME